MRQGAMGRRDERKPRLVVAVGGNALLGPRGAVTAEDEFENALRTAEPLVELVTAGCELVVTHGNGPQVGAALMRSELSAGQVYRLPYDCCVASTQGEIGYMLQYALWQRMQQVGLQIPVVTIVTQVRVDSHDPAFAHPTKPVGPVETRERARELQREHGFTFAEIEPGAFRRVVPSPPPLEIVELPAIRACLAEGLVVIAAGGGGIPVFNDKDIAKGVEAVIDKDLTSALLARQVGADLFVIATSVERVCLDHGTSREVPLDRLGAKDAERHLAGGQFPEGSMGPKILAALQFLEGGGREAIITDAAHLVRAVEGRAGTHVVPSSLALPPA